MATIYTVSFASYDENSTELYGDVCAIFNNFDEAVAFAVSEVEDTLSYYDEGETTREDFYPIEWTVTTNNGYTITYKVKEFTL